jgi:hypothetical protein
VRGASITAALAAVAAQASAIVVVVWVMIPPLRSMRDGPIVGTCPEIASSWI